MSVPQVPRRPASSRRSSPLSPIHAHPLDGDELGALWLWALRLQAATPVASVNAAGCALLNDDEAMTAVGPLVTHDGGELGELVDGSAGAHRTATAMSAIGIGVVFEDSDRYRVHDALPHAVVSALLGCVRSYDLIIRTAELAARDAAAEFGARAC